MLSKITHSTRSLRKPARFVYFSLAALTVLLLASPSYASGPGSDGTASGSTAPQARPEATCPAGGQCFFDVTSGNPFYAFINRIFQQDLVTGYPCGGPNEPCDPAGRPYYRPLDNVTRQQMAKFIDNARHLPGIDIEVTGGVAPIIAHNNTGTAISVYSTSGQALTAQSSTNTAIYAQSGEAAAVTGYSTGSTGASVGVYGSGYGGVKGVGENTGVFGVGSGAGSYGVYGSSTGTGGYGVYGSMNTNSSTAVYGFNAGTGGYGVYGNGSTNSIGVYGFSNDGKGVSGVSSSNYGVYGNSLGGVGAAGFSSSDVGVYGETSGTSNDDYGVYGFAAAPAKAGLFAGDVQVVGNLSKGAGSFKIDDPIDPSNKYLYHSFVESPDMMDIYNGNVTTDANGDATIKMPEWFDALNRDFRYQLTPIGQFAQAMVSQEVTGGEFKIKTDKPNVKVSWQLTGIRQDPYANAHRIPVEEDKPANEKGKYLHPTEWGQPASAGIGYDQHQQLLQQGIDQTAHSKP